MSEERVSDGGQHSVQPRPHCPAACVRGQLVTCRRGADQHGVAVVYKTSYTGGCLTVERICARLLMCQPQGSCTGARPVSTSCWIPSGSRKARSPLPQLEAACLRGRTRPGWLFWGAAEPEAPGAPCGEGDAASLALCSRGCSLEDCLDASEARSASLATRSSFILHVSDSPF